VPPRFGPSGFSVSRRGYVRKGPSERFASAVFGPVRGRFKMGGPPRRPVRPGPVLHGRGTRFAKDNPHAPLDPPSPVSRSPAIRASMPVSAGCARPSRTPCSGSFRDRCGTGSGG